jgi:hypothetical protein
VKVKCLERGIDKVFTFDKGIYKIGFLSSIFVILCCYKLLQVVSFLLQKCMVRWCIFIRVGVQLLRHHHQVATAIGAQRRTEKCGDAAFASASSSCGRLLCAWRFSTLGNIVGCCRFNFHTACVNSEYIYFTGTTANNRLETNVSALV